MDGQPVPAPRRRCCWSSGVGAAPTAVSREQTKGELDERTKLSELLRTAQRSEADEADVWRALDSEQPHEALCELIAAKPEVGPAPAPAPPLGDALESSRPAALNRSTPPHARQSESPKQPSPKQPSPPRPQPEPEPEVAPPPPSSGPAAEKDWAQMTVAEQKAAATLGWTEASWTAGDTVPLLKPWYALARHEQAAAERMGYAEDDFWQKPGDHGSPESAEATDLADPIPEPTSTADLVDTILEPSYTTRSPTPTRSPTRTRSPRANLQSRFPSAPAAEIDAALADAEGHAGKAKRQLELRGWPSESDGGEPADSSATSASGCDKEWSQMTSAERDAVCNLGWTRESWDAGDDGTPFDTAWQMLSPAQKRAAELLSYSPRDFGGGDAAPQPADDNWVEGYDEFAAAAELAPSISRPVEKVREKHLASPEMSVAEVEAAVRAEAPALLVGDRVEIWSKSVSAQPPLRLLPKDLKRSCGRAGAGSAGR